MNVNKIYSLIQKLIKYNINYISIRNTFLTYFNYPHTSNSSHYLEVLQRLDGNKKDYGINISILKESLINCRQHESFLNIIMVSCRKCRFPSLLRYAIITFMSCRMTSSAARNKSRHLNSNSRVASNNYNRLSSLKPRYQPPKSTLVVRYLDQRCQM